jgi:hypothetical protein
VRQADIRTLRREIVNPYAVMIPIRDQESVYRYADPNPPGCEGYQPRWEVVNIALGAQQTLQVRVDLMTDFHLIGLLASATVATVLGGFRAHLYDELKQRRIGSDRGILFPNLAGASGSTFFLREPYRFDLPRSQALVMLQNLEVAANTVQLVLYGVAAPFTGRLSNEP